MSRLIVRWAVPALVALGSLSFVWPAWAVYGGEEPTVEVPQAKEIAALIAHGQLNLRDATALAEGHVDGTALAAKCRAELIASPAKPEPAGPQHLATPSAQQKPATEKRLVYEVSCFARNTVHTVRIDGLARKVMDVQEQNHK
jgi:hypothetical protein